MRLDSFFSGALCVMSGGRLPAALFLVFLLDSKGAKKLESQMQEFVNLVDLEKCCKMITVLHFFAKIGVDIAENKPSKV